MRFLNLFSLLFLAASLSSVTLTVTTQGQGYVSSSPSGILCGAACTESYDSGTTMTLTATAQGGAFSGWSGACSGTQSTCTLALDSDKSVTATFTGATSSEYLLTVLKSGDGLGTVISDPYGIQLGSIAPYDSAKFQAGTSITLTASVQPGSRFDGWTGACSGTQSTCTVKMDSAISATALFSKSDSPTPSATENPTPSSKPSATPPARNPTPSPSPVTTATPKPTAAPTPIPEFDLFITKSGSGRGALYIWPQGRSQELCGARDRECTFRYPANTSVTFQTVPVPDSRFEGWSGACTGPTCSISLDGDKKLNAIFQLNSIQKTSHETEVAVPPQPSVVPPFVGPLASATPPPTVAAVFPLVVQLSGKGSVKTSDSRISCGSQCEAKYARYTQVPLSAYPAEGWKFAGWGGECRNSEGPGCVVSLEGSSFSIPTAYVRAVFEPGLQTLTVSVSGPGSITSSEYGIGSPYSSSGRYKTDTAVYLTAKPEKGSTFERWEGECTGNYASCGITMTGPKYVKAIFKGPPAPKKLNLVYPKEPGAKLKISAIGPGTTLTKIKDCVSNCSTEFKDGTKVELLLEDTSGYVWEGFGGACIGKNGNCYLDLYSDKTVAVSFSKTSYRKLTIVKPAVGSVVALYDNRIRCGSAGNECTADMDNRTRVILKFDGDYGLFETGCDAIWKRADQYGRLYEECVFEMNQDRTVKTKLSPEQEKRIVGMALSESFDMPDYPGLKEFSIRETDQPFQTMLAAYRRGSSGKSAQDVKVWIKDHWDEFLKDSGIGNFMQEYDLRIVRRALYLTFNKDIESNRYKSWFKPDAVRSYLYDAAQRPVLRGLREWFGMHKKPSTEFENHVGNNKLSYFVNEGIEPFFKEPPKATPTPPPRSDKPTTNPVLFKILPDNGQIGKPITLEGANLGNIWLVSIDGNTVESRIVDDKHIYLPKVRWGIAPDFGLGSDITFQNYNGRFSNKLDATHIGVTYLNAGGNKEQCFGAIGKGCGGLDGKVNGGEATNTGRRAGCEALRDDIWRACYISAGSIRHDNCCVWNPSGKYCGGPGTDGKPAEEFNHNGKCADEWHEAFWDSFWERTWKQDFTMRTDPNLSPYPSPNKRYFAFEAEGTTRLCAPAGTELREQKDAPFCCSGRIGNDKRCR